MRNEQDMNVVKQNLKDKLMAIILLESSKDYKEMDSDLIAECTDFLAELESREGPTETEIKERVKNIPFKDNVTEICTRQKKKLKAKRLMVVAAVIAVVIGIFGITSGATESLFDETFRKLGTSLYALLDGETVEYGNITFSRAEEVREYSSMKELVKGEEIRILYPGWLPEKEKIVKVWCFVENGVERYVLQAESPEYSINIDINSAVAESVKSTCEKKEISGFTVYFSEGTRFVQGEFEYKNNHYILTSDSKDNLIRTIESLSEIG